MTMVLLDPLRSSFQRWIPNYGEFRVRRHVSVIDMVNPQRLVPEARTSWEAPFFGRRDTSGVGREGLLVLVLILDSPSLVHNHFKLRCDIGIVSKQRAVSDVVVGLMLGLPRMHVDCWRSLQIPVSLVFAI